MAFFGFRHIPLGGGELLKFSPTQRCDRVLRIMGVMANKRALSADCVLKVQEEKLVPVHAALAAACSGFIRSSLRRSEHTMTWNGRLVSVVPIVDVPAHIVETLVEFMYTGQIDARDIEHLADIWAGADFLAMGGVVDAADDDEAAGEEPEMSIAFQNLAIDMLTPKTCFRVLQLGDDHRMPALVTAALEFAARHLKEVSFDWKELSFEMVRELVEMDDVGAHEDEVLDVALAWVGDVKKSNRKRKRTVNERAAAVAEVLSRIRPQYLSKQGILKLRTKLSELPPDFDELVELVKKVKNAAVTATVGAARREASSLVVIAGFNVNAYRYDVLTQHWTDLPPMPSKRRWSAGATLNGQVYFAGGYRLEEEGELSEVVRFDPTAAGGVGAWAAVSPMATVRLYAAAASLNGLLYVAGGEGVGSTYLSSVERYSPASNSWQPVASMATVRTCHQLVVMGGALFAIGGATGHGEVTMNSVERFDPATNTWAAVASMGTARYGHAAAVMGGDSGALYVAGGEDIDGTVLSSCERYDPVTKTWGEIADLPEPRCYLALACLRGSLYAVGGEDANFASSQSPPWRYDVSTNTWVVAPLAAGTTPNIGLFASWSAL